MFVKSYLFFVILFISLPVIGSAQHLETDNGQLHVKLDLTRGGAISYISKSGSTRSLVNIADEGRYIQQSYYGGQTVNRQSEGQQSAWSPWSWNPIQVGDAFHNRAQILNYNTTGSTMYVKCVPMLWDMNNKPAEAEMEQWTTVIGNTIHVRCRLTCHRTDNIYFENISNQQELPAVYPISALKNLYTYLGSAPYTNAAMDNPATVNLSSGFWGVYNGVSEHWMAFVDDNNWGMGVYNARCDQFLGGMAGQPGYEAADGSTSYIAPLHWEILNKNTVYDFEYDLIIGTVNEIRQFAYSQQAPVATQSSVDFGGNSSRAIDGNTSGIYGDNSVTHTLTEANPWWTLDRQSSQSISQLKIYNRTDAGSDQRLHDFYIFVSDAPFASSDPTTTVNTTGVSSYYFPGIAGATTVLDINKSGRYIRIQIPGSSEVLSLAEVEITSGLTPTTKVYSGEWNYTASPEGWVLQNSLSGTLSSNVYHLNVTNSDPYMISPDNLKLDASSHNYLTVRLKNNTSDTQAELFWVTDADGVYEGANKRLTIALQANSDYTNYTIDLSGNANWKGIIRQIRIDPVASASSGTVDIDYVGLQNKSVVTEIKSYSEKTNVNVYPNPAQDEFNLELVSSSEVSVVNLNGELFYKEYFGSKGVVKIKLDEKFASGVYLITIATRADLSRYKLIVNK